MEDPNIIPPLAVDEDTAETPQPRGTWVRLSTTDAKRIGVNIVEKLNLSVGASAAVTVSLVYFAIFLFFTIGFILTVPRTNTQVYDVTLTTDDYRASMKITTDLALQPIRVQVSCISNRTDENLAILYLMLDRFVLYKDTVRKRCYLRSTSGNQFQEERQTFKSLMMGKTNIDTHSKPTVHYLLHPTILALEDQRYLFGNDELSFCSNQEVYWITFTTFYEDHNVRQRKHSHHHTLSYEACLENLKLHPQKKWKS